MNGWFTVVFGGCCSASQVFLIFLWFTHCMTPVMISAVLALDWPGSQGFGLAFLGLGLTKP